MSYRSILSGVLGLDMGLISQESTGYGCGLQELPSLSQRFLGQVPNKVVPQRCRRQSSFWRPRSDW